MVGDFVRREFRRRHRNGHFIVLNGHQVNANLYFGCRFRLGKTPEFAAVATKASAKISFHVCVLCSLL
jgi:hypothetical protein